MNLGRSLALLCVQLQALCGDVCLDAGTSLYTLCELRPEQAQEQGAGVFRVLMQGSHSTLCELRPEQAQEQGVVLGI